MTAHRSLSLAVLSLLSLTALAAPPVSFGQDVEGGSASGGPPALQYPDGTEAPRFDPSAASYGTSRSVNAPHATLLVPDVAVEFGPEIFDRPTPAIENRSASPADNATVDGSTNREHGLRGSTKTPSVADARSTSWDDMAAPELASPELGLPQRSGPFVEGTYAEGSVEMIETPPGLDLVPAVADVDMDAPADAPAEATEVTPEELRQAKEQFWGWYAPLAPFDYVRSYVPQAERELWSGSVEMGLTGTDGNSQTFNIWLGSDLARTTKQDTLKFDIEYRKSHDDSRESANRGTLESNYERQFGDSRWTWNARGKADYDEFRAFDLRLQTHAGLGYRFIFNERTKFVGRLGVGGSNEIGGPEDDFIPELEIGANFERQINDRQKLTAEVSYTPDVTDFSGFRVESKMEWEVLLDEATNLSLKTGLRNRYDSTPNGAKPNDIDYSVVLLWKY